MKHIAKRVGDKNIYCLCTLWPCRFLSLPAIKSLSFTLPLLFQVNKILSSSFSPFHFLNYKVPLFIYLCVCVCMNHTHTHTHAHLIAHMWRSEDNWQELVSLALPSRNCQGVSCLWQEPLLSDLCHQPFWAFSATLLFVCFYLLYHS